MSTRCQQQTARCGFRGRVARFKRHVRDEKRLRRQRQNAIGAENNFARHIENLRIGARGNIERIRHSRIYSRAIKNQLRARVRRPRDNRRVLSAIEQKRHNIGAERQRTHELFAVHLRRQVFERLERRARRKVAAQQTVVEFRIDRRDAFVTRFVAQLFPEHFGRAARQRKSTRLHQIRGLSFRRKSCQDAIAQIGVIGGDFADRRAVI